MWSARPSTSRDIRSRFSVVAPLCSEAIIRGAQSALDKRSTWYLRVIGRLKPDIDRAQAAARIASIARASYAETLPPNWAADSKKDYLARSFFVYPAGRGLSHMRS